MRLPLFLAVALVLPGCIQVDVGTTAAEDRTTTGPGSATVPVPRVTFTLDPASPRVDQAVLIDLRVTGLGRGDSVTGSAWRFGDGTTSSQREPIHVFKSAGPHAVEVTITTALGATARAEQLVEVRPRAAASAPPTGTGTPMAPAPALASPAVVAHVERNLARFAFEAPYVPDTVLWSFGDGATSTQATPEHMYLSKGRFEVEVRLTVAGAVGVNATTVTIAEVPFFPRVVVGVPDSGFNVYHEIYRRPEATEHPCTYVRGYPCDVPALRLTLDAKSWEEAYQADLALWQSIRPGDRYWIPGTNIIGAVCDTPYVGSNAGSTDPLAPPDYCILGDSSSHGTGTSSSVLSENPDALLVVVEGNSGGADYLTDGSFPIDVVSYSWGAAVPIPILPFLETGYAPLFVAASGNEGAFPVVLDGDKSHPSVFTVGGADGATRTEPGYSSFKTMDFVSEYCRPAAHSRQLSGEDDYCGTSFAAPTFAGALSRVVLELRRVSGYDGGITDGVVDPRLGVTKTQVREALNRTASYSPESPFPAESDGVPLAAAAPFYQWGWGYVARNEVPEVLACLLDGSCPQKDAATVAYMEALWEFRQAYSP